MRARRERFCFHTSREPVHVGSFRVARVPSGRAAVRDNSTIKCHRTRRALYVLGVSPVLCCPGVRVFDETPCLIRPAPKRRFRPDVCLLISDVDERTGNPSVRTDSDGGGAAGLCEGPDVAGCASAPAAVPNGWPQWVRGLDVPPLRRTDAAVVAMCRGILDGTVTELHAMEVSQSMAAPRAWQLVYGQAETGRSALPRWPTSLSIHELRSDSEHIHDLPGLERQLFGATFGVLAGGAGGASTAARLGG